MLFLRRSLIGVLLMALTFGALLWAAVSVYGAVVAMLDKDTSMRPNREVVLAVNVRTVSAGYEVPILETFGEIESRRTLDVRSAAEGRIVTLSDQFQNGGQVAAGDLLIQIDPAQPKADLALARADLRESQSDLRDAIRGVGLAQDDLDVAREQAALRTQALDRQMDLQTRGVGSGASVEAAALDAAGARQSVVSRRQALAQAEARVAQMQARQDRTEIALSEAERLLADTEIRARFDGTLSDVTVVEGGLVARNDQLASLVDPSALQVVFRLSTAQYTRLLNDAGSLPKARLDVVLDVAGLDISASGAIVSESAVVGAGQTGRQVFAHLNTAVGFRPGDIVTVRIREPALIQVARLPALSVDSAGLVLVVGDDDRLKESPVDLLRRQGDMVLVRAPNLEGARVVAERTPFLGAGIKVRALPEFGEGGSANSDSPTAAAQVSLTPERRQQLIDYVTNSSGMPPEARVRVLALLSQDQVPARVVHNLEERMGS